MLIYIIDKFQNEQKWKHSVFNTGYLNHWSDLTPDLFSVQLGHGVGFPPCLRILSWKKRHHIWLNTLIARMIKNLSIQKINKCSRPIFCTTTLKFFKVSSSLISLSQHYSDNKFCTSVSWKINMYCSTVHSNESMLYCEFKFDFLISILKLPLYDQK